MNTEAGDDEEEKDGDVAKGARDLDQPKGLLQKVGGESFGALIDGVIEDHSQSGGAAERVDATQARPLGGDRWGIGHLEICRGFTQINAN
jgi:hypothetical protein